MGRLSIGGEEDISLVERLRRGESSSMSLSE